jgi:hypothetical protein
MYSIGRHGNYKKAVISSVKEGCGRSFFALPVIDVSCLLYWREAIMNGAVKHIRL